MIKVYLYNSEHRGVTVRVGYQSPSPRLFEKRKPLVTVIANTDLSGLPGDGLMGSGIPNLVSLPYIRKCWSCYSSQAT